MARIGYARVSTRSQNDDSQVDDLTAYGCDKIFTDTVSGKHAARPELDKALAYLRAGDVVRQHPEKSQSSGELKGLHDGGHAPCSFVYHRRSRRLRHCGATVAVLARS